MTCPCGCGETRSAFNVALDYAQLGMSAREAVENISQHYRLTDAEQEQMEEDVADAMDGWRCAP